MLKPNSSILIFVLLLLFKQQTIVYGQASNSAMPEPLGGFAMLDLFIKHNARVPLNEPAQTVEIKGIIRPDGPANLEVVKGTDDIHDKEALRLMGLFKAWAPLPSDTREKPFYYIVNFPEKSHRNFKRDTGEFEFYFDKREQKTNTLSEALYKVNVPADVFGVPKEGSVEICKLIMGNWVVIELGEVKYSPEVENTDSESGSVESKGYVIALSTNIFKTGLPIIRVSESRQLKMSMGEEGVSVWQESGMLKSVSVSEGKTMTREFTWYPNGLLKTEIVTDKSGKHGEIENLIMVYDSLATPLIVNGNGYIKGIDDEWGEGLVENGLKNGTWKGVNKEGEPEFEEVYKKGVLQKGVSRYKGKNFPYTTVRIDPEFRGGWPAWYKYLTKNIVYPHSASQNNIQGQVLITFVVGINGEIMNVVAQTNFGFGLEDEAVRVVKNSSGKWVPGMRRGKKVKVQYTLPVKFTFGP